MTHFMKLFSLLGYRSELPTWVRPAGTLADATAGVAAADATAGVAAADATAGLAAADATAGVAAADATPVDIGGVILRVDDDNKVKLYYEFTGILRSTGFQTAYIYSLPHWNVKAEPIKSAAMSADGRFLVILGKYRVAHYKLPINDIRQRAESDNLEYYSEYRRLCEWNTDADPRTRKVRDFNTLCRRRIRGTPHLLEKAKKTHRVVMGFPEVTSLPETKPSISKLPAGFVPWCCALDKEGNGVIGGASALLTFRYNTDLLLRIEKSLTLEPIYACQYHRWAEQWVIMTATCVLICKSDASSSVITLTKSHLRTYHLPRPVDPSYAIAVAVSCDNSTLFVSYNGSVDVYALPLESSEPLPTPTKSYQLGVSHIHPEDGATVLCAEHPTQKGQNWPLTLCYESPVHPYEAGFGLCAYDGRQLSKRKLKKFWDGKLTTNCFMANSFRPTRNQEKEFQIVGGSSGSASSARVQAMVFYSVLTMTQTIGYIQLMQPLPLPLNTNLPSMLPADEDYYAETEQWNCTVCKNRYVHPMYKRSALRVVPGVGVLCKDHYREFLKGHLPRP